MLTTVDEYPTTGQVIKILDKGYVRLAEENGRPLVMGSDLNVVNSARVSFQKESTEFSNNDMRLLEFLIRRNEYAPFRHSFITFEMKAPLFVARQIYKYAVGSSHVEPIGWSEGSRRYVTADPEFYVPHKNAWRGAPPDKKQGSEGFLGDSLGYQLTQEMLKTIEDGLKRYYDAMELGVAPELARGFLPAYFMYIIWRWSASLNSILHFLNERLADKAQWETRQYAKAVHNLTSNFFPVTMNIISTQRQNA